MNSLQKILVVDDGERERVDPLAVELAELGVSSVTTSFEATQDVLNVIERPAAIFLKLPRSCSREDESKFIALGEQLRANEQTAGIPVILWDGIATLKQGGISEILRRSVGVEALSLPEL